MLPALDARIAMAGAKVLTALFDRARAADRIDAL
jgi:hypothetical protein